jgi:hypothetical protein
VKPDAANGPVLGALTSGDAGLFPSACGDARGCDGVADFHGVWGSARDDVWVIGTALLDSDRVGIVVHWDGRGWTRAAALAFEPTAICGNAADDVWMVGRRGQVAHFDGVEWRLRTEVPSGLVDLAAVWSGVDGSAWIAGSAGTLWRWTGTEWTDFSLPTTGTLEAIAGSSPSDVWVAGELGLLWHWDGRAWQPDPSSTQTIFRSGPRVAHLRGLSVDGSGSTWLVGDGVVAKHENGSWARFDTSPVALPLDAWQAVVSTPDEVWIVSAEGRLVGIFDNRWGPPSWAPISVQQALHGLWRAPTGEVYVVGSGDAVLLRTDQRWVASAAAVSDGAR